MGYWLNHIARHFGDLRIAQFDRSTRTVLTSSRQRPWQNFTATFVSANKAAGITNLHFHDLRGTAATRFYIAGLKVRTLAKSSAGLRTTWKRSSAIKQLNEGGKGTLQNRLQNIVASTT
jgi:hypothetical protein